MFPLASKASVDMDLDPETWDNKTITSGLKNYLRSACPTSCVSLLTELSLPPLCLFEIALSQAFSIASDSQRLLHLKGLCLRKQMVTLVFIHQMSL